MAVFTKDIFRYEFAPEQFGWRLDFKLLQHGPVTKFYRLQFLDQCTQQLQELAYQVHRLDCSQYATEAALLTAIARALQFEQTEYEEVHFASFEDWLWSIEVPEQGGTVLSLARFDLIVAQFPEFAQTLLDVLARSSHNKMLFGKVFMTLIQSNDPRLDLNTVGGVKPHWNFAE